MNFFNALLGSFSAKKLGATIGLGVVLFVFAVTLSYFGVTPQRTAAMIPKPDALQTG